MEWEDSDEANSQGSEDGAATSRGSSCSRKACGGAPTAGEGIKAMCMSTHALLALNDLRQQNLLCDAVVRLDDGSVFRVHRAILSACSSYFRSLFTTTLHSKEVTDALLPDVTSSALQGILDYVYLRTLNLSRWNVCQILMTADYLCVDGAQRLCCNYIRDHLVAENCIGIMLFARAFACHDLETYACSFLLRNFVEVAAKSEELLRLSMDDFCLIIGNDLLNVKSEEAVWQCVLRWVSVDPVERKRCLSALLRHIRLGLLDTQYFLEKVKDHEYVVGNDSCRPIIIETLRFLYDLEMIAQKDTEVSTPAIARPRVPHEILFAIGGWSGGSPTNYIETYDTRADRWIKVNEVDPTGPRAYHGTAVLGHNIYVIGGFDGLEYFNSCRCFNAVSKTWREVAPMNGRRCYVSVAVLDDVIYALGGYDGHHRQNSGERYDHLTNQWTLIAPMNMQRSDANATALNGKLYITGGFNGQECMNSVEVYDPTANQWTVLSPMRSRRSGVSCIAFRGSIYVVGGFNGISRMCSAERYNPNTDQWTPIPDMYNPRSNFAIEVIDDLLFAIGGFNGVTTIFHVECFDENLNEWFEATDMNIFRSALSACVVRNLPNLYDYIHQHREQLMEEKRLKLIAQERMREEAEEAAEAAAEAAAAAEDAEDGGGGMGGVGGRAADARHPPAEQDMPNAVWEADAEQQRLPGPLMDRVMEMPMVQAQFQQEDQGGGGLGGLLVAVVGMDGRQFALIDANGDDDENPFDLAMDGDEEEMEE